MKRRILLSLSIVALLLMITALPGLTPAIAAQCGGTIRVGQTVTGSIARAGVSCPYTFASAANETVTITMEWTSRGLDPYLELKDRSNRLLAYDDDSGGNGNSRIIYRLPAADTYTIVARAYNNASSGNFRLRLESSAGSVIPISANTWVPGTIASNGQRVQYAYTGAANETVTIAMERVGGNLDPYLELKDRRGGLLAYDDDSGGNGNSLITYRLPAADTYIIVARAYNDASSGNFRLRLDSSTGGGAIPITANTWVPGAIAGRGQRVRYTFSGTSGDVVNIAMRATSPGLDPWLDLMDPRGTIVAYDDDSLGGSNSLISRYRLLQTGQYTIVARAYNDASTGSFELRLER